jgi:hypothetical protein
MAAYLDKTQTVGFYYGNATKELADRLPPEDGQIQEITTASLLSKVDSVFETLDRLERKNQELRFLISDISKLLK